MTRNGTVLKTRWGQPCVSSTLTFGTSLPGRKQAQDQRLWSHKFWARVFLFAQASTGCPGTFPGGMLPRLKSDHWPRSEFSLVTVDNEGVREPSGCALSVLGYCGRGMWWRRHLLNRWTSRSHRCLAVGRGRNKVFGQHGRRGIQ